MRQRRHGQLLHVIRRYVIPAFYQRMGSDDAVQHGTDGWAALAADMLEFARTRKRGRANVRLFNPTLKEHGWESAHTVVQVVNDDMPFLVIIEENRVEVSLLSFRQPLRMTRAEQLALLTAAGALVGCRVFVPVDKLAPLPEGEYYWHELIGMEARTEEGTLLGRIAEIFPTGGHDVYVCRTGSEERLLPAIEPVYTMYPKLLREMGREDIALK